MLRLFRGIDPKLKEEEIKLRHQVEIMQPLVKQLEAKLLEIQGLCQKKHRKIISIDTTIRDRVQRANELIITGEEALKSRQEKLNLKWNEQENLLENRKRELSRLFDNFAILKASIGKREQDCEDEERNISQKRMELRKQELLLEPKLNQLKREKNAITDEIAKQTRLIQELFLAKKNTRHQQELLDTKIESYKLIIAEKDKVLAQRKALIDDKADIKYNLNYNKEWEKRNQIESNRLKKLKHELEDLELKVNKEKQEITKREKKLKEKRNG